MIDDEDRNEEHDETQTEQAEQMQAGEHAPQAGNPDAQARPTRGMFVPGDIPLNEMIFTKDGVNNNGN